MYSARIHSTVTMLNGCQIIGLDAIGWQIKNVNRRIRYDAPEQVCYERISFTAGLLNSFEVLHYQYSENYPAILGSEIPLCH